LFFQEQCTKLPDPLSRGWRLARAGPGNNYGYNKTDYINLTFNSMCQLLALIGTHNVRLTGCANG